MLSDVLSLSIVSGASLLLIYAVPNLEVSWAFQLFPTPSRKFSPSVPQVAVSAVRQMAHDMNIAYITSCS